MKKKIIGIIITGLFLLPVFVSAQGILGNNSTAGLWLTEITNSIFGAKFYLPETGKISSLNAYIWTNGLGGGNIKGAIYDENRNLIKTTEEVWAESDNPYTSEWYNLEFPTTLVLESGYYFLTIWGDTAEIGGLTEENLLSTPIYYKTNYTYNGYPNPLPDIALGTIDLPSIYANYELPLFTLGNAVGETTGIITDLVDSIGPFIWAFIGIPLGFVVVRRIIRIMP